MTALAASLLLIAGLAASICAGLVFLLAGASKLRHRDLLPGVIANYRLLPERLVTPAALLLPAVELLVGAALVLGARPWAPLAAILLLLAFAAAMAINIRRGRRHIDCGCGQSALRQELGWPLVVRNLLLAALLLPRLVAGDAMTGFDVAVAACSGLALFLLYLVFNALNALPGQALAAGGRR